SLWRMFKFAILAGVILSVATNTILVQRAAEAQPRPPCGGQPPAPAYSPAGSPPAVGTWSGLEAGNRLSCAGWTSPAKTRTVVALAGKFKYSGTASGLFVKLGRLSAYPNIKYWSRSAKSWQPLVLEAG